MLEVFADPRFYVGVFMMALAGTIYWVGHHTAFVRLLALYLVIRGALNAWLPMTHEGGVRLGITWREEIAGHLTLGSMFAGLIFATYFTGHRRATAVTAAAWLVFEAMFLWDSDLFYRGPLAGFVVLGSFGYFVMGLLFLAATRNETDPLARSGLLAAAITSWAFPAFAGGADIGWLVYYVNLNDAWPTSIYTWWLLLRILPLCVILGLSSAWVNKHPLRAWPLLVSATAGFVAWAGLLWTAGSGFLLWDDTLDWGNLPNALTTLAMPIGLAVAAMRLIVPGDDARPRQAIMWGARIGLAAMTAVFAAAVLVGAWWALAPLALMMATVPWWAKWSRRLAQAMFPYLNRELSLHRRVQIFQGHYARSKVGGSGVPLRLRQAARNLGIPEWLIERIGPFPTRIDRR